MKSFKVIALATLLSAAGAAAGLAQSPPNGDAAVEKPEPAKAEAPMPPGSPDRQSQPAPTASEQSSAEAQSPAAAGGPASAPATTATAPASEPPAVAEMAKAINRTLSALPPMKEEAEALDRDALKAFYTDRGMAPIWMAADGATQKAKALASEIADAAAYGLDPKAFDIPDLAAKSIDALAKADVELSLAALKYAYHARGGRIPDPAAMLNSNLDRKPQLHEPRAVLEQLSTADDVAKALVAVHPVHPQFERLRQAFLAETKDGKGGGKLGYKAERLRANMEFWRWMWDDLGDLYVFNNIPEYMQYVVKDGKVIRKERIVVGEISKQSSIFSRPLKEVVLRPRWRVPESIMVHELWPSLLKGGSLMRSYGLEITTKNGDVPRDWRTIDWSQDDIRNYHVWQPPGRKSVLGFVKFSFPSQHTIFMHDTPDKWMFNRSQRTLSHGCLRVRNPMELTEIVLDYDRGWDRDKIKELVRSGPLDNEVTLTKHVPIHLAYFTAWVGDDGKVKFFRDIYGHEKRVRQALDGEWSKIDKGRNHLAPVKPRFDPENVASKPIAASRSRQTSSTSSSVGVGDLISDALGSLF